MNNVSENSNFTVETLKLLSGKKGLIMGIANEYSLAWHIAKACYASGAELACSYQTEGFSKKIAALTNKIGNPLLLQCDVADQDSIANLFIELRNRWDSLDFVIHSLAFSDKNQLKGKYVDTTLDNFLTTMNISCYSFTAIARYAAPLMPQGGSLITLSYYGAEKAIPNYNVMGLAKSALESSVRYLALDLGIDNIRVNAISAGTTRTLAAAGISNFRVMLNWAAENTPLRRNVTGDDVGKSAVYLASDLSTGVTGEVLHVDSGYHALGMRVYDELREKNLKKEG